jgi:hypothetical protein
MAGLAKVVAAAEGRAAARPARHGRPLASRSVRVPLVAAFPTSRTTTHRFAGPRSDGRLADENRLWGAPRIHGELLKLGLVVSERTVSRYLRGRPRTSSQTWRTFLANHLGQVQFTSELPSPYALEDDAIDACARAAHSTPSSDWRCGPTQCSLVDWPASGRTGLGDHFTPDHIPDRMGTRRSTGRAPPRNVGE